MTTTTILIRKTCSITDYDISIARKDSSYTCGRGNGLFTLAGALSWQDNNNNAATMVSVQDVNWDACTDTERDTITKYYQNESITRRPLNVKDYPSDHAFLAAVLPIYEGWFARDSGKPAMVAYNVHAVIIAEGADSSTAHDHNDGSVDADISYDGTFVGSVTLVRDRDGDLVTWGDRDMWADSKLQEWLDRTETHDWDDYGNRIDDVVLAVRRADNS